MRHYFCFWPKANVEDAPLDVRLQGKADMLRCPFHL